MTKKKSLKKVILSFSWDIKQLITIDFHKIGATVNSVSYC